MTHDGSEGSIDFTISKAICDLMGGKPEDEVADDLGWDTEEIIDIHPMTISSDKLIEIANEQYWPKSHLQELLQSIERYRTRLNAEEAQVSNLANSTPRYGEETNASNNGIIPMLGMTLDEWDRTLHRAMERKKKEDEWRETVALQLETMDLIDESVSVRRRVVRALRSDPDVPERYARAVKIMMDLIPLGLNRSLGVKSHLLASISREYKCEHDLLWRAIKEAMRP